MPLKTGRGGMQEIPMAWPLCEEPPLRTWVSHLQPYPSHDSPPPVWWLQTSIFLGALSVHVDNSYPPSYSYIAKTNPNHNNQWIHTTLWMEARLTYRVSFSNPPADNDATDNLINEKWAIRSPPLFVTFIPTHWIETYTKVCPEEQKSWTAIQEIICHSDCVTVRDVVFKSWNPSRIMLMLVINCERPEKVEMGSDKSMLWHLLDTTLSYLCTSHATVMRWIRWEGTFLWALYNINQKQSGGYAL